MPGLVPGIFHEGQRKKPQITSAPVTFSALAENGKGPVA